MNPELLLTVLIVILLASCSARGSSKETKIAPDRPLPSAGKPNPENFEPAYGLPLEFHIEVPEVPKEIQCPSPPIPEGTPMPRGILNSEAKQ